MKAISTLFGEIKPVEKKNGPRIDFEFQAIGLEMMPKYGRKVWPLFYRYPLWKIKEAWKVAQEKQNFGYDYLIGVIKHL